MSLHSLFLVYTGDPKTLLFYDLEHAGALSMRAHCRIVKFAEIVNGDL